VTNKGRPQQPSADGIIGPVSGTEVPRFAGSSTFACLPRIDEVSDYSIALLGAPFDGGTSFRPGARFGLPRCGRHHAT
jgi:guanidinobutyrase / D-arginase